MGKLSNTGRRDYGQTQAGCADRATLPEDSFNLAVLGFTNVHRRAYPNEYHPASPVNRSIDPSQYLQHWRILSVP